jgi:hypothetical protein
MIAILIYSFIETASEPIEKSGFFESFAHPGVSRMPFEMVFAWVYSVSKVHTRRDVGGDEPPSRIPLTSRRHSYSFTTK